MQSLSAISWLRRLISTSLHQLNKCRYSTRQCPCHRWIFLSRYTESSVNSMVRRWDHNRGKHTITTTKRNLTNPNEKRKVDPFAKRPSQKCDPYGLAGKSLPFKECLDLLGTLEDGWKLVDCDTDKKNENEAPIFLQKHFYHATFQNASLFLSHLSLVCTNLNHYAFLSIERVLVDDMSTVSNSNTDRQNATSRISKQQMNKIKGWIFVSTVRCSTYRPSIIKRTDAERIQHDSHQYEGKGLTYHDFHLAMNIDVETNRDVCAVLLL